MKNIKFRRKESRFDVLVDENVHSWKGYGRNRPISKQRINEGKCKRGRGTLYTP